MVSLLGLFFFFFFSVLIFIISQENSRWSGISQYHNHPVAFLFSLCVPDFSNSLWTADSEIFLTYPGFSSSTGNWLKNWQLWCLSHVLFGKKAVWYLVREWKPEIAYSTRLLSHLLLLPSCLLYNSMRTLHINRIWENKETVKSLIDWDFPNIQKKIGFTQSWPYIALMQLINRKLTACSLHYIME